MPNIFAILVLGLLLGFRHALDADHVITVSNLVSTYKSPGRAVLIGTFWGLGHTTTIFLVGLSVLLFKINIPQKFALVMEMSVGIMLVFLGVMQFKKSSFELHFHKHEHDENQHSHIHDHNSGHFHPHKRSFLIGGIHGLAGSGALMLLVLTTVKSTAEGIIYILVFGLGSIGGMSLVSLVLSLPYLLAADKFPGIHLILKNITGILSIIFGLVIIYEIATLGKIFG